VSFSIRSWAGTGISYRNHLLGVVRFIAAVGFWSGIALFVVSLAGPVSTTKHRVFLSRGVDIMFVLDESPSMFATDLKPALVSGGTGGGRRLAEESRFQAAKHVISEFVERRENDPVGLVSFAKQAVLRIPPTLDYRSFLKRLGSFGPHTLGNGTAIGMGLGVAVLHLKTSNAPKKAIVLLTDGENNAGEVTPAQAALAAADSGIRIYTVGIGSAGVAPITYTDPETGELYTGLLHGAFDADLLKNLAATTGGRYFNASTSDGLSNVLRRIDLMESVQRRTSIQTTSIPRHRSMILWGFFFVLGSFLIREGFLREALG
jgi:Ca-activated chloride channel family protein